MAEVTVVCPICRQPVQVPAELREVVRSVRQVGCDDCLWRVVRQPPKAA